MLTYALAGDPARRARRRPPELTNDRRDFVEYRRPGIGGVHPSPTSHACSDQSRGAEALQLALDGDDRQARDPGQLLLVEGASPLAEECGQNLSARFGEDQAAERIHDNRL